MNRNKRPVKPESNDIRSIDGIVAGIMALRGEMENNQYTSEYEDSGSCYNVYA